MNRFSAYIFDLAFRFPRLRGVVWAVMLLPLCYGAYHLFHDEVVTYPVGWERSIMLTPYALSIKSPYAVSKGNVLCVVFEADEKNETGMYILISLNGGRDFLPPRKLAVVDPQVGARPHVAISNNGHIACTWHDLVDSRSRIFLTVSHDLGATWSNPAVVSFEMSETMLSEVYYDINGALHLFFHGSRGGRIVLFHAFSPDELHFTRTEAITSIADEYRGIFFPAIALDGDNIYIVYQAKLLSGNILSDDLLFVYSDNAGRSFSRPKRITTSPANDSTPSLLLHNNVLYCVYQSNERRQWDIMLIKGYDRGKNWDVQPVRVTDTSIDCYLPRIAVSSEDELLIVWHDMRQGYSSVYGRKFSLIDNKLTNEARISDDNVASMNHFPVKIGRETILFWNSRNRLLAKFSDISVLPPAVFSTSHPEGRWSQKTDAIIEWNPPSDESGIVGYAVIFNELPFFDPTVQNVEGPIRKYMVPDLPDGITYFHIRAIDKAGNYSRTVNFPLRISSTILPMPVISSPTHPEAAQIDNPSPLLQWHLDDMDRVKGFYYSIAKDAIAPPSAFTEEKSVSFSNLSTGRYFFTVSSVDFNNIKGRIATYEIVIGDVAKADAAYYEKLSKGIMPAPEQLSEPTVRRLYVPTVLLDIPFNEMYSAPFYSFQLVPKNISARNVSGFSVAISSQKAVPPFIVTHTSDEVRLTNLKPGNYTISVRMRYKHHVLGTTTYRWSPPSYKELTVKSAYTSPLMRYTENLYGMIKDRQLVTIIYSIGLLCLVLAIGMSTRIAFSIKAIRYRILLILR